MHTKTPLPNSIIENTVSNADFPSHANWFSVQVTVILKGENNC